MVPGRFLLHEGQSEEHPVRVMTVDRTVFFLFSQCFGWTGDTRGRHKHLNRGHTTSYISCMTIANNSLTRVVDTNPHGSPFIFPPGSGPEGTIEEKTGKMQVNC